MKSKTLPNGIVCKKSSASSNPGLERGDVRPESLRLKMINDRIANTKPRAVKPIKEIGRITAIDVASASR